MAQIGYYAVVSEKVQRFWANAAGRWINALGLAQSGSYTANQFASDLVMSSTEAMAAWQSLLGASGGHPTLPTTTFGVAATFIQTKSATAEAYLAEALGPTDPFTWTPELLLAGRTNPTANPIRMDVTFPSAWRERVSVGIKASSAAAPPDTGVYVGAVFGKDDKPILGVVANVV